MTRTQINGFKDLEANQCEEAEIHKQIEMHARSIAKLTQSLISLREDRDSYIANAKAEAPEMSEVALV